MAASRPGRGPTQRRDPRRSPHRDAQRQQRRFDVASAAAEEPKARFTHRAALLLVVFAVLVVSYASSMQAYLSQRDHIADLEAEIAASEAAIAAAEREEKRWQDRAYVEAQVRERFGWVLPGEVSYQVLDEAGKSLSTADELMDPETIATEEPVAWWDKFRDTVDRADHPEKFTKSPPATSITP